jgi:hypothetical protein
VKKLGARYGTQIQDNLDGSSEWQNLENILDPNPDTFAEFEEESFGLVNTFSIYNFNHRLREPNVKSPIDSDANQIVTGFEANLRIKRPINTGDVTVTAKLLVTSPVNTFLGSQRESTIGVETLLSVNQWEEITLGGPTTIPTSADMKIFTGGNPGNNTKPSVVNSDTNFFLILEIGGSTDLGIFQVSNFTLTTYFSPLEDYFRKNTHGIGF